MTTQEITRRGGRLVREWKATLDELLTQVAQWATEEGWKVESAEEKEIRERTVAPYTTRVITLALPTGRVVLEPIARQVPYADGAVDLYAWPTLHRVRLLRRNDTWIARTESGIDWPKPWGREMFIELAGLLAAAR